MLFAVTEDEVVHFFRLPKAEVGQLQGQFDIVDVDISAVEEENRTQEIYLLSKIKGEIR